MFKGQRVLALIPARGGSKRLPGKNLICIADKPLLGWTINAGLESEIVDKLILSTDDRAISNVGCQFGVDEVLIRPTSLGEDDSSMTAVIQHALQELQFGDKEEELAIMLKY